VVEEPCGFFRGMLAVGIDGDDRIRTALQRSFETGSQRGTLAEVVGVSDHAGPSALGCRGGPVGRAVVHHQHLACVRAQFRGKSAHHGPDAGFGLEGRHDHERSHGGDGSMLAPWTPSIPGS
jgi:hypothetical protein